MTLTIKPSDEKKAKDMSLESMMTETNKVLRTQAEEISKFRDEVAKKYKEDEKKELENKQQSNNNSNNNSDSGGLSKKEIAELKSEREKFLRDFFKTGSKNQQSLGLAVGGVPGAIAANLLGGPLNAFKNMGVDWLKKKYVNRGLGDSISGKASGASDWSAEEKRAAPLKKMNKDINSGFKKLFKLLGGKKDSPKKESWLNKLFGWLGKGLGKIGKFLWKPIRWVATKLGKLIMKPFKWLWKVLGKALAKIASAIGLGSIGNLFGGRKGGKLGKLGKAARAGGRGASRAAAKSAEKAGLKSMEKTVSKAAEKTLGKTAGKAGSKAAGKAATKAVAKKAAKAGGKGLLKGILKKIPGVSLIAGGLFAAQRALAGDWKGAALEMASGVAGCIPGAGTAVSTAIDAGLAVKDVHDATKEANEEEQQEAEIAQPEVQAPQEIPKPSSEPAKSQTKATAKNPNRIPFWKRAAISMIPGGGLYLAYKDFKAATEKEKLETSKEIEDANKQTNVQISQQMTRIVDLLSLLTQNLSPATQAELDKNYLSMIYSDNSNQFAGFSNNSSLGGLGTEVANPVA